MNLKEIIKEQREELEDIRFPDEISDAGHCEAVASFTGSANDAFLGGLLAADCFCAPESWTIRRQ